VQIQLCKKSVERLPGALPSLLSALRDREHSPVVKDCLNRCEGCERGGLIAIADGMPMSAPTFEAFLNDLEALAAEDA
jgi:hypothetical protein